MSKAFDLSQFGLTGQQSLVYQIWLQIGLSPVSRLARSAGIHRVTVYNILKELLKKGFATSIQKSATSYYQMVHPSMIYHTLQEKAAQFEQLVPDLISLIRQQSSGFSAQLFEGIEWVSRLYLHLLNASTPLRARLGVDHIDEELKHWLYATYLPERLAKKITNRVILSSTDQNDKFIHTDHNSLTETVVINREDFVLNCEIVLFDENKLLIATMETWNVSGMLIENKLLHDSLGSIFELIRSSYVLAPKSSKKTKQV